MEWITKWLIDSVISVWPAVIAYWILLYIVREPLKKVYNCDTKAVVVSTLILFLAYAFNSANRPKFDRVPDQWFKQKAYEEEVEYKASKEVKKTISIQEQHKNLVEETKKKFEY